MALRIQRRSRCLRDIEHSETCLNYPHVPIKPSAIIFALLIVSNSVLTGCFFGLPVQTESPSDHFDVNYLETHQHSTKQEVVKKLGVPGAIFRLGEKTYYVYDARGDTRTIVGAAFIAPPFFVPFWAPKDEGDALHCLALIFDERGLLQDYIAETASEEAFAGILTFYGPAGGPLAEEVTKCTKVLWDEEELRQLQVIAQYKQPQSLVGTALAFGEVAGVPLVAAADENYNLHLWDVSSDCLLDRPLIGHEDLVTTVTFGEVDNVPVVISGSADKTIRLWDIRTGDLLYEPLRGHENRITHVAVVDVDGVPTVYSGGEDRTVRMWDARTGHPLGKLELEGQLLAVGKADGALLVVTSSVDQTVQLWKLRSGRWLGKSLMSRGTLPTVVTAVSLFQVEGKPVLASGGEDGSVRRWNVHSGRQLGNSMWGHKRPVTVVSFGELGVVPALVSADETNTMCRWNAGVGGLLSESIIPHGPPVVAIKLFSVDGSPVIVTSSSDLNVRLWDGRSGSHLGKLIWYDADLVDFEVAGHVEQAAKEGDAEAQLQLYWSIPSPNRLKWLCRAADQGLPEARYRLGVLYEHGSEILPKDNVKSYQWYMLSTDLSDDWAGGAREAAARRIYEKLTPKQMTEAERLVSEWHPGQCEIDSEIEIEKQFKKKICAP